MDIGVFRIPPRSKRVPDYWERTRFSGESDLGGIREDGKGV